MKQTQYWQHNEKKNWKLLTTTFQKNVVQLDISFSDR